MFGSILAKGSRKSRGTPASSDGRESGRTGLALTRWWSKYRTVVGWTLLVLSAVPWLLLIAIPRLGFSVAIGAAIATGLIVSAEVLFVASIAVLGTEVYDRLKTRLSFRGRDRSS